MVLFLMATLTRIFRSSVCTVVLFGAMDAILTFRARKSAQNTTSAVTAFSPPPWFELLSYKLQYTERCLPANTTTYFQVFLVLQKVALLRYKV